MSGAHQPETPAVTRLTSDITPPGLQVVLVECLSGNLSPAAALMRMLIQLEDAAAIRAAIDKVTARAATLSRPTDNLLRDRVDDLTQLVVDSQLACERIAEELRAGSDLNAASCITVENGREVLLVGDGALAFWDGVALRLGSADEPDARAPV